jgi:cyclophilin family peptidyl-prolyl cis-trans isomerase
MSRIGFFALSLCLLSLAACAISEPNPAGGNKNNPADSKDNPTVVMETSMGTVKMVLYQDKAPITVANFLKYVDDKHYDGTIFHRVISGFMIQGGGFEPGLRPKSSKFAPIKNEAGNGVSNERGTVAMARTPVPDSATDQFFINVVDNSRGLDRKPGDAGYAVFGKVIDGMEVVDKIRYVRTRDIGDHEKVPVEDIVIKSIRRAEAK